MLELLEIADLLLSWRLWLGIAVTASVCYSTVLLVPDRNVYLLVIVPVGIVGVILSFWWQIRADQAK